MKLLIADDDPQLVRALRITLGAHGYEVVAAADGAAAISVAAQARPDLILLDLGMPRLDGIQVIQALRGWTDAPIIVVSGRTGSADKVEALDAGADDFVTKPFQIDELLARLRALARRTQVRPRRRPSSATPRRPGHEDSDPRRPSRTSDADRVADAGAPRPPPRSTRHPRTC